MEVPKYMQKGSKGPHVIPIQIFLVGWAMGLDPNLKGLIVDGDYGEKTAEYLIKYQIADELEPDGNFGPETRARLLSWRFDFEAVCRLTHGHTHFVQPDGSVIEYASPRTPPLVPS